MLNLVDIRVGDVLAMLAQIPSNSIDCVVTSPPYWGLRDYGVEGQIGLERSLGEHLAIMVRVFREIRRVLKPQGTLWLNYGDCYAAAPNGKPAEAYKTDGSDDRTFRDKPFSTVGPIYQADRNSARGTIRHSDGEQRFVTRREHGGRVVAGGFLKPKDLCMIPNRLAIALQDDGWYVRSEIIWHKPNPMPESVYDRPTSAHEKIWLLTKSEDYFYNHEAIREPCSPNTHARLSQDVQNQVGSLRANGGTRPDRPMKAVVRATGPNSRINVDRVPRSRKLAKPGSGTKNNDSMDAALAIMPVTRNARNVWTIAPKAFRDAHFATFPPALAERCIKAGTPLTVCGCCGAPSGCGPICETFDRVPGVVLDPFGGAGTVGLVAQEMGLRSILIELNPEYAEIAWRRIYGPSVGPIREQHFITSELRSAA
ncbi:site-specific DNA-methyltransferase [Rhizorhabdus sp.]|uniref:DNA-methyltransferase n=1 Tax=Rhizorhabdus sp. TaxID=1968843 RepID=UPI0035B4E673